MRLFVLMLLLISTAPLVACADESPTPKDVEPSQSALTSPEHPPVYDSTKHDMAFIPDSDFTYGEYVEHLVVDELEMEAAEFYAKNPAWEAVKSKRMTTEKVMLGVHL